MKMMLQQSIKSPILGSTIEHTTNRKPVFISGTTGSHPSSQHRHQNS